MFNMFNSKLHHSKTYNLLAATGGYALAHPHSLAEGSWEEATSTTFCSAYLAVLLAHRVLLQFLLGR